MTPGLSGRLTVRSEIALATELTNLANDKVQLIKAQNNYEIAKAQLNQSMGIVAGTAYDVAYMDASDDGDNANY